jgi:chemotaxis protein MotB
MATTRPIVVVKKNRGHGQAHGGAWKVAYADFVTAMMALFIVLWLMNSSKQIQQAVGGYFKDPTGTSKMVGSDQSGSGENFALKKDDMPKLKEELQKVTRQMPNFELLKNQIQMTISSEGLRIELSESESGTFFDSGSARPTASGRELLTLLAGELGKLPNHIYIEGHTDSKPFGHGGSYTNWELSADRANQCRQLMQANGVRADQVSQVRGFADQSLRDPTHPEDARNRRISVIVRYIEKPSGIEAPDAISGHGGDKETEKKPD